MAAGWQSVGFYTSDRALLDLTFIALVRRHGFTGAASPIKSHQRPRQRR